MFQGYRVLGLQGGRGTGVQGCRAGLQGSRLQGSRVKMIKFEA